MNGKVAGKSVNGKTAHMGVMAAWCALLMLVAVMLGGCTAKTTKAYTFKVETGDSVKVALNTTGGYDLTKDLPLEVKKGDDVLAKSTFIKGEYFDEYSQKAHDEANVLDEGEHDGNRFVFWEYTQDDASEYAYVIEVKNSSTGVLLSANSQQEAEDAFGRLTISLAGK